MMIRFSSQIGIPTIRETASFVFPSLIRWACFRKDPEQANGSGSTPDRTPQQLTENDQKPEQEKPSFLRCCHCRHNITTTEEKIAVNNAHHHTFANPGGIVFHVGCFRSAPGCSHSGLATDEFTWFPGYKWQIAVCSACLLHMGWRFSTTGSGFYALILDHLIESEQGDGP
ncbi:MAG: cereblon family protein [Thermodesulfobacteriota bacterium]|nr:cereblon family protein [Thermodesulfobacteriota bacterium]